MGYPRSCCIFLGVFFLIPKFLHSITKYLQNYLKLFKHSNPSIGSARHLDYFFLNPPRQLNCGVVMHCSTLGTRRFPGFESGVKVNYGEFLNLEKPEEGKTVYDRALASSFSSIQRHKRCCIQQALLIVAHNVA